jgi:2-methylcitrate dehydratase PrpD
MKRAPTVTGLHKVESMKDQRFSKQHSTVLNRLARYMSSAIGKPLPARVLEATKHHLLDSLASMVSGAELLPGRMAIKYAKAQGGRADACVAGTRILTSLELAAMTNGMLAHADETDDAHGSSLTHPGCAVVPAALAMGEREGCGGGALLRAVALGYDVCARLGMSLNPYEFRADGHSPSSFGPTFGAAAAAGALAGLGLKEMRYLLSYSAQQASGISCWMRDEEHIEKAFDFGGMPARNGVAAAAMVYAGFTGVEDVFSGERNFFMAYGRKPQPELLIKGLGKTYEIVNTNIKRWSAGSPIAPALDSLFEIIKENNFKWKDVGNVLIKVSHQGANTVGDRIIPDICMEHMCALMLADSNVTFASSHDKRRVSDPIIAELRKRIRCVGDDALERVLPSRQAIVILTLKNGLCLENRTVHVRGTPSNPMSREDVDAKSFNLLAPVLGQRRARKLCDVVWRFEEINNVREIRKYLMI